MQYTCTESDGAYPRLDVDGLVTESSPRIVMRPEMALAARGVRARRMPILRTVETSDGPRKCGGYVEQWKLAAPIGVRAAFATDRCASGGVGWFDHEVLTGDASFDARVRVETSTPEAMRQLLASEGLRRHVGLLVERGGALRLANLVVLVEVVARPGEDPALDEGLGAAIVLALLDHDPIR